MGYKSYNTSIVASCNPHGLLNRKVEHFGGWNIPLIALQEQVNPLLFWYGADMMMNFWGGIGLSALLLRSIGQKEEVGKQKNWINKLKKEEEAIILLVLLIPRSSGCRIF